MTDTELEQFRFQFKFRFHRLLHMQIDERDMHRLAAIYGVAPDLVEEETAAVEAHNAACAAKIAANTDLSPLQAVSARVLFLGDSITSDRTSYCGIIRKVLEPYEKLQVFDTSVPGNKVIELYSYSYPETHEIHADIAHIMLGTNDILCTDQPPYLNRVHAEDFAEKLDYVVRCLTQDGTKVILTTIPVFSPKKAEVSLQGFRKQYREEDRVRYNQIIRDVAVRYGVVLNDMEPVYAGFTREALTWNDGYHMSPFCQSMLAEHVLQKILQLV